MTPYNTGRVQIGRCYIPQAQARDAGCISGPHRNDRIVVTASVIAMVCLAVMAVIGWL